MNQRERMLGTVVGILVLVVITLYTWDWVSKRFRQRRNTIEALQGKIDEKQRIERQGQRASTRLAAYQARSLPANRNVAKGLYSEWLLDAVTEVGFTEENVDPLTGRSIGDVYFQLGFRVTGKGTLDQVVELLHRVYSVNLMHRVHRLILKPVNADDTKTLDLDMEIDALVLSGAEDRDTLIVRPSKRLALPDLSDYVDGITNRNAFSPANNPPELAFVGTQKAPRGERFSFRLKASDADELDTLTYQLVGDVPDGVEIDGRSGEFRGVFEELGEYEFAVEVTDDGLPAKTDSATLKVSVVEPEEPPVRDEPSVWDSDDAKFTFVNGIVEGGERWIWLEHRTSGERFKLQEGDSFRAGRLAGKVVSIGLRDVRVAVGDETQKISLGKSFSEGTDVVPDET